MLSLNTSALPQHNIGFSKYFIMMSYLEEYKKLSLICGRSSGVVKSINKKMQVPLILR